MIRRAGSPTAATRCRRCVVRRRVRSRSVATNATQRPSAAPLTPEPDAEGRQPPENQYAMRTRHHSGSSRSHQGRRGRRTVRASGEPLSAVISRPRVSHRIWRTIAPSRLVTQRRVRRLCLGRLPGHDDQTVAAARSPREHTGRTLDLNATAVATVCPQSPQSTLVDVRDRVRVRRPRHHSSLQCPARSSGQPLRRRDGPTRRRAAVRNRWPSGNSRDGTQRGAIVARDTLLNFEQAHTDRARSRRIWHEADITATATTVAVIGSGTLAGLDDRVAGLRRGPCRTDRCRQVHYPARPVRGARSCPRACGSRTI